VLGCFKCPQVSINNAKVLNVSARSGSAFALVGGGRVEIRSSSFFACYAGKGGAIYIENMAFEIAQSTFIGNQAERTGRALEVNVKSIHFTIIRTSTFCRNKASEGGVIRWSNAEIRFSDLNFSENSADYGADVASYGVALSLA